MFAYTKPHTPLWGIFVLSTVLFLSGCPHSSSPQNHDGEITGPNSLAIISPPGKDVGLFPGQTITLQARYTNEKGEPLTGKKIDFSLLGEAGGSTLEQPEAVTNIEGIAQMVLMAGYTESFFEVEVTAEAAPAIRYSVAVSDAGFGALAIYSSYSGSLDPTNFSQIEVSLYLSRSCSELNLLRPSRAEKTRVIENLETPATFDFLPLSTPYTITASAKGEEEKELAFGCIEMGPDALKQNSSLETTLPISDLMITPADSYIVRSEISISPQDEDFFEPSLRPWLSMGECEYGCSQSLLDCLVGSLENPTGNPEDIVCGQQPSSSTIGREILALRGELSNRCRSERTSSGIPSIDKILQENGCEEDLVLRLKNLAFAEGKNLMSFTLLSSLYFRSAGTPDRWVADHRIHTVRFTDVFDQPNVNLHDLGSTHLSEYSIPVNYGQPSPTKLLFGAQWFSFRLGRVFLEILNSSYLGSCEPGVLNGLKSLWHPKKLEQTTTSCENIDAIVCSEIRRSPGCLGESCDLALRALAYHLEESLETLDASGTNLSIPEGSASVQDNDQNREAEILGTLDSPGTWQMQLNLSGQKELILEAPFFGSTPITPIR